MSTFQIFTFKFFPLGGQAVAFKNTLQPFTLHRVLLDELENPVVVLRSASSQGDRDETYGGRHNPSRDALDGCGYSLRYSLGFEIIAGGRN